MAKMALVRKSTGRNISVKHTADLENGSVIGYKEVMTDVVGEEVRKVQNLTDGEPFAILICDCHRYKEDETDADFILKAGQVGRAYIPMRGDVYEIDESFVDTITRVSAGDLLELKADEMKFAKKNTGTAVARLRRKGLTNILGQKSCEIEII